MLEIVLIIVVALMIFFILGILFTLKVILPNWINKLLVKEKDMSLDWFKDVHL